MPLRAANQGLLQRFGLLADSHIARDADDPSDLAVLAGDTFSFDHDGTGLAISTSDANLLLVRCQEGSREAVPAGPFGRRPRVVLACAKFRWIRT